MVVRYTLVWYTVVRYIVETALFLLYTALVKDNNTPSEIISQHCAQWFGGGEEICISAASDLAL